MHDVREFDVIICGASIAGCSAARLFARAGARVALVEQRADPDAYKVICTHQILSCATPTIERMGLRPELERAGAIRTNEAVWSPHGGWLNLPRSAPHGFGITRSTLDPLLRRFAAETPGVTCFEGWKVDALDQEGQRVTGVHVGRPDGKHVNLSARLTVAADGRDSTIARLADVRARVRPNNRFFYFAYWRGLRPETNLARLWFLDPDAAAAFPNENDLTVIVTVPHRDRLTEFRADPEAAYLNMVGSLPDGPDLNSGELVSRVKGTLNAPNKLRLRSKPGLAFAGDAAVASDPTFGTGCGWAFQGAEDLVSLTAPALSDPDDLEKALLRYRRRILLKFGLHHVQIADFSRGNLLRPEVRLTFRAGARYPAVGEKIERFATRRIGFRD
jgi:2-polyprenyl-6-methoxyphenol hydroxylase-like FAD-dependent oxidoreductase